jgi:hypothetical protein
MAVSRAINLAQSATAFSGTEDQSAALCQRIALGLRLKPSRRRPEAKAGAIHQLLLSPRTSGLLTLPKRGARYSTGGRT